MNLTLANLVIGPGRPAMMVAELSGNHGGTLDRALALVDAAKQSGADAVKLQTYRADTITLDSDAADFRIPEDSPWASHKTMYALYEEAHTPWEWHSELFAKARDLGLVVFSTPFDVSAVEFLEDLDCPAYKIAAPEIVDIQLLEAAASTGKPIILSTGLATIADIHDAVEAVRGTGNDKIVILKSTSAYPAPESEANLRTIPNLMDVFGCLSGLSDHTPGIGAAIASVCLGGSMVEKHFRLDDGVDTVDSFFSLTPAQFQQMVEEVRRVEAALGGVVYEPTAAAAANRRGRRSLYVANSIRKGEEFTSHNIRSVRPGLGLDPRFHKRVLGLTATRDLAPGDRLTMGDVQWPREP